MGATATFSYPAWAARYPEFSTIAPSTAAMYFSEATLYHRNDGGGPVADAGQQLLFLNMLTAHIAYLNSGVDGTPASPLVGTIANASEGSVSVGVKFDAPQAAAYFTQSKYGAAYWAATSPYRRFQYRAPPGRNQFF